MTDDTETTEEAKPTRKTSPTELFCRRTGYSENDIVGVNLRRRVFVTSNGGKYQLGKSGVRTISGPKPPKEG